MVQQLVAEKDQEITSLKGMVASLISPDRLSGELDEFRGSLVNAQAQTLAFFDSMVEKLRQGSTSTAQTTKKPAASKRPPSGGDGPTKGAKAKRVTRK